MSNAGVYTLISNDGKQDRLLMATDLLSKRLKDITDARMRDGATDPSPTLPDVERTHVMFMNAHFKPFCAMGFEYTKVKATSGSPQLGSDIQFSIPQYGDFFHDMCLHVKLKQPTMTATASSDSDKPLMRWASYPGERLCSRVQFEVSGNPLDEYTSVSTNLHRELEVPSFKRDAWDRCMGQEVPESGFLDQPNWARSGVAPSAISHRSLVKTVSGNQTPTGQKSQSVSGDLELFIPMLLWFSRDSRLSIPSVAIPYGQRFINIKLAEQNELVGLVPRGASTFASPGGTLDTSSNLIRTIELYVNNIFVMSEIHDLFIKRVGFTLIRAHREHIATLNTNSNEILLNSLKWPTESLAIGCKLSDYVSSDSTLRATHLDKWNKFSKITKTTRQDTGFNTKQARSLTQSAGDAAAMAISGAGALTGPTGTDFVNEVSVGDTLVVVTAAGTFYFDVAAVGSATTLTVTSGLTAVTAASVTSFSLLKSTPRTMTVDVPTRLIDSVSIVAHGTNLYNDFPQQFFNSYLPYQYGGTQIQAPEDSGVMFVTFSLYPGTYQPSGHINISRSREFYFKYSSSVIDSNNLTQLNVSARAINFLVVSDGSAVLRYST